jgi:hypothetical protein
VVGAVGLVPAVLRVMATCGAGPGRPAAADVLVLAALAVVAWFTVTYRLLALSVSC